jgi:protein TonB
MFEYAATQPRRAGASSFTSTLVSALAHAAVLVIVAVSGLSAADALPEPPAMLAFVVASPPPPPPPPPPPAAAPAPKPEARAAPPRAKPIPRAPVAARRPSPAAAPVEMPAAIRPETGLEAAAPAIAAGFEYGVDGGIVGGVTGGVVGGGDVLSPPPPPPPPPPSPVRVGGNVEAPQLLRRVAPVYPDFAAQALIEGVVILEAVVDEQGRVQEVKPLRAHPLLKEAAIDAVEQWRYEPLRLNGVAMPFVLTVTVTFRLG